MSEATLKPRVPTEGGWADSPWQRMRDALPPRTVCGLAVLVGLLIPALLLWFPMPLVIGGVVGLLILTLVLACPYAGLIIFLGLLYLRPEEIFPKLAGARMTLVVSLVTLFAWAVNALLRRERSLLHLPVVRCFIGFVALAIGSTAYNVPDLGTLSGVALDVIKLLILFVLVVHLVNTESRLRVALGALLLLTAIMGARTIWQYQNGEAAVMSDGDVRALGTGIFGDPNDLALAMAMALPLALGFAFGKVRLWTRLWSLAAAPILVWTIYVTNSRGGMLALAASLFLFFGRRLGRVGAIVGAVVVLALFAFGPSRLSQMSADEESAQGRVVAWEAGMDMLKSSPVWGVGKDQFTEHHYLTAHNSLVLCLAELGLAGTICWIGLFYFAFQGGQKVVARQWSVAARQRRGGSPPAVGSARASSQALLLQISLTAFLVGGFFLSRTYTPSLYVYLGLMVAAAQVETEPSTSTMPTASVGDWLKIVGITLAGLLLVMGLVRLWS